jgi:predicted N-acyltransferase
MTEAKTKERTATVRVASSIAEIGRDAWDAVANPGWPSDRPLEAGCAGSSPAYNPFLSFDFLDSLERSGSATARTGWAPYHLVLEEGSGQAAGVMPLYLKNHSMGEYVFDHGWADAYQRAGGRYYPKLQGSVPFTPATGRRLLTAEGPEANELKSALANAATELARRERFSSVHITFMPKEEWDLCAELGYLKRTDQQFHFINEGYRDFDDFLDGLVSRKRKALKRERRDAVANGLTIDLLTGSDITEAAWDAFFAFYMDTGGRKWGRPYLNRRFFAMIGERMPDQMLLVLARNGSRYVAGALNFIGSDTLYGRYWGSIEYHPFLHFELCYYQAIDWAIAHGLKRVEAGAQGEHKLARGYAPTPTYSAHWITDPGLRKAVAHYLDQERKHAAMEVDELSRFVPFRRG